MKKQKTLLLLLICFLIVLTSCKKCPDTCNDGNSCTKDYCSEATNYECRYDLKEGCHCGNKECEKDLFENKCTCPKDCGECNGAINEYVENSCIDDECISIIREDIDVLPQTFVTEIKSSGININTKLTYTNPLNYKLTNIGFFFRLDDFYNEAYKNLKINRILIKDGRSILVSEYEVNKYLKKIGDEFEVEVPVTELVVRKEDFGKEQLYIAEIDFEFQKKKGENDYIDQRSTSKIKFGPFLPLEADK